MQAKEEKRRRPRNYRETLNKQNKVERKKIDTANMEAADNKVALSNDAPGKAESYGDARKGGRRYQGDKNTAE